MTEQLFSNAELKLARILIGQLAPTSIEGDEWSEITAAAREHFLLPFLHVRVAEAGTRFRKRKLAEGLRRAYFAAGGRDALYQQAQANVEETLERAGVRAIWLKGTALRYTVYPLSSVRAMADLDFIVEQDRRQEALDALLAAGYTLGQPEKSLFPMNTLAADDRGHHYVLKSPLNRHLIVELHFRLLGVEGRALLSDESLAWLVSNPMSFEGPANKQYATLNPEAHLLYLCAHNALQHGLYEKDLLRFLDVHLLLDTYDIDWDTVVEKAAELRWSYAVERVLALVQDNLGTSIPDDVLQRLHTARQPDENSFLVDMLHREGARRRALLTVLRAYPVHEQIRVLIALVLPSQKFMRERYNIPSHKRVLPYYVKRWTSLMRSS